MSETIGKLAAALAKAQAEIRGAKKDAANPFFKSTYADLASVWDACREPLSKNELAVCQPTDIIDGQIVVKTILMHSSGESITGILPVLVGEKATSQQLGSAITYNRRYALAAIAGVAPEDDDGNKASETSGKTTFAKPSMTDDLKTRATELVKKIELCESKEELESVVEKNAGLISTIATASSEWHKRLLERIEEQRAALSPPA